jgi:hypothetical protein
MNIYSKFIKDALEKKYGKSFFKVHQTSSMNSYRIEYIDGVCAEEIEKIVFVFEKGYFDSSTDCYCYTNKNGFAKYIFINRIMSEQVKKEIEEEVKKNFGQKDIDELPIKEQIEILGRSFKQYVWYLFNERNYPFKNIRKIKS